MLSSILAALLGFSLAAWLYSSARTPLGRSRRCKTYQIAVHQEADGYVASAYWRGRQAETAKGATGNLAVEALLAKLVGSKE